MRSVAPARRNVDGGALQHVGCQVERQDTRMRVYVHKRDGYASGTRAHVQNLASAARPVNRQKIGDKAGVDLRVVHHVVLQDLLGRVHGLGLEHAGDHEKMLSRGAMECQAVVAS